MATDQMVARLMEERDKRIGLIEQITGVADEAGRDLQPTEDQTIAEAQERVRSLNNQIDRLTQDLELAESAKSRIRSLDPNVVPKDFQYRSAGEFLWDLIHQNTDQDASLRINKMKKRAAEHLGFDKTNTVPVAGGYTGLIIAPVVGPVLNPYAAGRPLFNGIGPRPAPSMNFIRPVVSDPNIALGVGPVAQEKSEMPSKAWDVVGNQVTLTRLGGYINVSEVLVEMLAGSLDMVVEQMNVRLAYASEAYAVTALTSTTNSIPLTATDDAAAVQAAIGQAAAAVVTATGQLPTFIAMGPTGWGRLIGLTDLAGRAIIPPVNPVNAQGTGGAGGSGGSFFGLDRIVTNGITDSNLYVGNSLGLELYERPQPLMQAMEPSLWGRQLAVATFVGNYIPVANSVVEIAWAEA